MGSKIIKERSLNLEFIPKKKTKTDWSKSKECLIPFIYGDIKGTFIVKDYIKENNGYFIIIEYNKKEYKIATNNFLGFKFGNIVGTYNKNYLYNVGDTIETKTGKLEILEQIRYPKNKQETEKGYKYKCLIDENIDIATETHIKEGGGCNVCCPSTVKVLKGYNDIATTHPHLMDYFNNIEDAYKYSYSSNKRIWVICPNCEMKKEIIIDDFCRQGFSCNKCGKTNSFPNKFMFNILTQLKLNFKAEYSPKWCKFIFNDKLKQGRYDFYIPSMNLIIEMDGGFHNKDNKMSGQTVEESKFIDDEKDRLALENGYYVIRIDCDYPNLESRFNFIKTNVINKLKSLLNLYLVNWNDCLLYSESNLNKTICDEWNSIKDIEFLMKKYQKRRDNIRYILKLGVELKWCDYKDTNELRNEDYYKTIDMWNSGMTRTKIMETLNSSHPTISTYLKRANSEGLCLYKPKDTTTMIYCIETNTKYDSLSDCKREFKRLYGIDLDVSSMTKVCKGKLNHYKGYHFKYVSDLTVEELNKAI